LWVVSKTHCRSKKAKRKSQSRRFCFHITDRIGISISRQYFFFIGKNRFPKVPAVAALKKFVLA
jgi:hypothetical protein